MRRVLAICTTLFLLVGLVGGGVAAAGERDGKRHHKPDRHRAVELTLYAAETSSVLATATGQVFHGADAEEVVPGPGDRFLVVDALYADAARTDEVGRNLIECTLITAAGETEEDFTADVLCNGVVTLTGQGDLAWQGQFRIPESFLAQPFITVAITGGTAAFARAGGEVAIFDEDAPPDDPEATLSRYEVRLFNFKAERPKKR